MFLRTHTKHLYIFDEVYSSLQKSIRRGIVDHALFWAGEFLNSGNSNPLWNRLFIILYEDIYAGSPELVLPIWNLYKEWKSLLKINKKAPKMAYEINEANICIIKAIKLMCIADKSREINNICGFAARLNNENFDINNEAKFENKYIFPKSTNQTINVYLEYLWHFLEKNNKDGFYYCTDVILQLEYQYLKQKEKILYQNLKKMTSKDQKIAQIMQITFEIYEEDLGEKRFAFISMAFNILNKDYVIEKLAHSYHIPKSSCITTEELKLLLNPNEERIFAVPDYAIDKHTMRGKGSSTLHLLQEEGKKRRIADKINGWTAEEIAKSHGKGRVYPAGMTAQDYFYKEGIVITPISSRKDEYKIRAQEAYTEVAKTLGIHMAKGKQMLKIRAKELEKISSSPMKSNIKASPIHLIESINLGYSDKIKEANNDDNESALIDEIIKSHEEEKQIKIREEEITEENLLKNSKEDSLKLHLQNFFEKKDDLLAKESIEESQYIQLPFDYTWLPDFILQYNNFPTIKILGEVNNIFPKNIQLKVNPTNKIQTFVSMYKNNNVFIKGPYDNNNIIQIRNFSFQLIIDSIKYLFGLQPIGIHPIKLRIGFSAEIQIYEDEDNRKPYINTVKKTKLSDNDAYIKAKESDKIGYYLMMKDFGPGYKNYPRKHVKNLVYCGEVIDKEKIVGMKQLIHWSKVNNIAKHENILWSYIDILLFRNIMCCSDTNLTNILINETNQKLLSIDENYKENMIIGDLFSHKHNLEWTNIIKAFIKKHKDNIIQKLEDWLQLAYVDEKFLHLSHIIKLDWKNNIQILKQKIVNETLIFK